MKIRFLWPLVAVCMNATAAGNAALPSVMSINLCTDQMVMLLADPGQVRALSSLSRDEAGSYFHAKALAFEQAEPQAEDILPRSPDIVVAGAFTSRYTLTLLDELDTKVETLEIADSIQSMLDNILRMGSILQQRARAEALVASIEQRLQDIDARVALLDAAMLARGETAPRAAVYDANGYTVGLDSLRGEAMARAGWHNVAVDKGIQAYGVLALEDMIRLAPEALLETPYSRATYSRGQMLVNHPALRQAGLDPMIISLPSNLTICAGPWLIEIIEKLVDARERLRARDS